MSDSNLNFYNEKETAEWLAQLPVFSGEIRMLRSIRDAQASVVADIGCGSGRLYKAVRETKAQYLGSDLAETQIAVFRSVFPEAEVCVADACDLPWKDASADVAMMSFHVLEAILPQSRRLEALREARRVLREDGQLFLSHHVRANYRFAEQVFHFSRRVGSSEFGDLSITGPAGTGGIALDSYKTHIPSSRELEKLARLSGFKREHSWNFASDHQIRRPQAILEQWSTAQRPGSL